MIVLGISAYYHDSSAALLVNGKVAAATQEERFTRQKHDNGFPLNACRFCLDFAGIEWKDVDAVVFYEKPFLKFERILTSYITTWPMSLRMFIKVMPVWLKYKLNMRRNIRRILKKEFGYVHNNIRFVKHHLSHAALAYCASGFDNADILVTDAVGEWTTTSVMRANGAQIERIAEQRYPDSIGFLYSAFTQFLGFKVNSDEYKVMGLAAYGDKKCLEFIDFVEKIKTTIVKVSEDGSIHLNLNYFKFHYSDNMIATKKWEKLFGMDARINCSPITCSHENLALAIQAVTKEILSLWVKTAKAGSSSDNLCISGGVALNCAANGVLLRSKRYKRIYIPFAPGDCGCSIGAAVAYDMLVNEHNNYEIRPYLGPQFDDHVIEAVLREKGLKYEYLVENATMCEQTARLIADGNIIGWFQGRMEVGPRALGNRSILADARNPKMKDAVNSRIKFREPFRPFAPSVLEEHSADLFSEAYDSPFMMFTVPVKSDSIPAVTHVDGTARIQTVNKTDNPLYHQLITAFYKLTGCPAILNTSFNVMGEPIVCTPQDAINTFKKSGLDYLVIGHFIVKKI